MKSVAGAVGLFAMVVGAGSAAGVEREEGIRFDFADAHAAIADPMPVVGEAVTANLMLAATIAMQDVQPAAKPAAPAEAPAAAQSRVFGKADGSWWLTLTPGVATNFGDLTSVGFRGGLATFVADGIQVGGEVGLWEFQQPGDNAFGGSVSFVLRWHFVNEGKWTVFADGGIGVLFASDEVPQGGTNVNFMPRIGVGVTRQITDGGVRLEAGLGWHHISNARINGDDENPSRDLPMLHFGLIIPL